MEDFFVVISHSAWVDDPFEDERESTTEDIAAVFSQKSLASLFIEHYDEKTLPDPHDMGCSIRKISVAAQFDPNQLWKITKMGCEYKHDGCQSDCGYLVYSVSAEIGEEFLEWILINHKETPFVTLKENHLDCMEASFSDNISLEMISGECIAD